MDKEQTRKKQQRRYTLHANMRRYGYPVIARCRQVDVPYSLLANPPRPLIHKWIEELKAYGYEFQVSIE
ncbi:MAG: hypothetical protein H6Q17_537 [Bacteroidetes bacterium]|nr:hypothetical protein [Bacteroidota bacterium]